MLVHFIPTPDMRLSKQALAYLKYLYDERATFDSESPDRKGSIRGFLLAESEDNLEPGARGRKVIKMGTRYNSIHRTALKLYRGEYVTRKTRGPAFGYEYKLSEKGLEVLRTKRVLE